MKTVFLVEEIWHGASEDQYDAFPYSTYKKAYDRAMKDSKEFADDREELGVEVLLDIDDYEIYVNCDDVTPDNLKITITEKKVDED